MTLRRGAVHALPVEGSHVVNTQSEREHRPEALHFSVMGKHGRKSARDARAPIGDANCIVATYSDVQPKHCTWWRSVQRKRTTRFWNGGFPLARPIEQQWSWRYRWPHRHHGCSSVTAICIGRCSRKSCRTASRTTDATRMSRSVRRWAGVYLVPLSENCVREDVPLSCFVSRGCSDFSKSTTRDRSAAHVARDQLVLFSLYA
jgi:hypothetical protein